MIAVTNQDVPQIMAALIALKAKSPAGQMPLTDPMEAECSIRYAIHQGRCYRLGGYFVMYDVGNPWYTREKFLIEDIIIKVWPDDKSVKVEQVIESLSDLARALGCVAVAAGDTQIGFMLPKYVDQGFVVLGTQLFKRL